MVCLVAAAMIVTLGSCRKDRKAAADKKVVIIGFDGMDPRLCTELMDAGRMPHLNRMRQGGGFKPLGTSIPPQSPVAWSNFITGAGPGVHGIFDFIHRDPSQQVRPYYSAAETIESDEGWHVGEHTIPLTFPPFDHNPTQTLLRREGKPFWDYLDEAGIETRIYDIPANYPPSESKHGHMCCLSGMGVPDLLGSYGTYQVFSEGVVREVTEGGGVRKPLTFRDGAADTTITGPMNTTLKKPVPATIPMRIHRNGVQGAARIDVQGQTILLKRGEWSDWVRLDFELRMPSFMPNSHASGIVRFYLKEVSPTFRMYMTPVNIDPTDPGDSHVSEPPEFVTRIADDLGLFYTAGFQEDHKALSNEVFTDAEYHEQADYVLTERLNLLDHAMGTYRDGLLFFYFSSTDLQSHMYWWRSDAKASDADGRRRAVLQCRDREAVRADGRSSWSRGRDVWRRCDDSRHVRSRVLQFSTRIQPECVASREWLHSAGLNDKHFLPANRLVADASVWFGLERVVCESGGARARRYRDRCQTGCVADGIVGETSGDS